jgi:hypothetical protein
MTEISRFARNDKKKEMTGKGQEDKKTKKEGDSSLRPE